MKSAGIYIGTSGWHYKEWEGKFYPADHPAQEWLVFYMRYFNTVEINSPFYHLPLPQTVKRWYDEAPSGYQFAIKASRFITHIKKLGDPKESISKFFQAIKPLKEKTGPIIFQLPPHWKSNPERLEKFLEALPKDYRYAFELREPDWLNKEIYQILEKHNAAFCIYDFDHRFSPIEVTSDLVYIRLHGPDGKYVGSYSEKFLQEWAKKFKQWKKEGRDVYCYFDNTADGSAVVNAQRLQFLVDGL